MLKRHLSPNLKQFGRKVRSQNDEDGIIEKIFFDIPPRSRFFVEFGIGPHWSDKHYINGLEGNCLRLREQGWNGLFMDGGRHPPEFGIQQEFVTAFNINGLLRKWQVPDDLDIVSIDVDGQDLWIWLALDLRPTLVIIEMNSNFPTLRYSCTVPFDADFRWDGTKYYGASLGALVKVGYEKGYKLVYANGVNAFFVRQDYLANPGDFIDDELFVFGSIHKPDHFGRRWVKV